MPGDWVGYVPDPDGQVVLMRWDCQRCAETWMDKRAYHHHLAQDHRADDPDDQDGDADE